MIDCIVIDDEPLALNLTAGFVKKVPFLNLVGTFESSYEAMGKARSVGLLFLDINMPDLNGVQFIKSMASPPKVIFTTAYEQYAVEGFELNAIDYLLKPFSFERFLKATDKAYESIMAGRDGQASLLPPQEEFIFIKAEHNTIKINLQEIVLIEGYKDYLKIHLVEKKPILTLKSMKSMDLILKNKGFVRVHRSYLVPIHRIEAMRQGKILVGERYIPIGDHYKANFEATVLKGRL